MSILSFAWRAALVFLGFAGAFPTSTATLGSSHAEPARNYLDAVTRIERQQRADDVIAVPGARSMFLSYGQRTTWAVVLLHGFANSPEQFHVLAESLHMHGANVWVPLLPHHAERSGATMLSHLKAEDLRACADSSVDIAEGLGDSVVVLGFSTGGVVAAWIAQHRHDVRRVVIVSPAFALAHVPTLLDDPFLNVLLRIPNITHGLIRDSTRSDREIGWSTRAVAQVLRLGLAVERSANHTGPTVHDIQLLLNAHDRTINGAPAIALGKRWAATGANVAVYKLPDSLRLPHDLIDPTEPGARPTAVYPVLEDLVRGDSLPSWVAQLHGGH